MHNSGHNSGLGSQIEEKHTANPYYGRGGSNTTKDLVNSYLMLGIMTKKIDPTHLDPGQIDRDPNPYIP